MSQVKFLKAADLNVMLHDRSAEKQVTVQKICTRARNEAEVREALSKVWDQPAIAGDLLNQSAIKNAPLFEFEKALEHEDLPQMPDSTQNV